MICSSVNRLGFMSIPSGDGLHPFLEEFSGLRSHMTTEQKIIRVKVGLFQVSIPMVNSVLPPRIFPNPEDVEKICGSQQPLRLRADAIRSIGGPAWGDGAGRTIPLGTVHS
jgi:hypothetical protein